jgi:hypothetical protein
MSRTHTAVLDHTMEVDKCSIEKVEVFKYLRKTLTDQGSIQKQIMNSF